MISYHCRSKTFNIQLFNMLSVLYQNRFCNQENFDIIITGLHDEIDNLKSIYKVKFPRFTRYGTLVSKSKYIKETLTSASSMWTTCYQGTKKKSFYAFKALSRSYELPHNLVELPESRGGYCICSFMKNLYVLGGHVERQSKRTCLKYSTKSSEWTNFANLYTSRNYAACTVFDGKIVVSGGFIGWNDLESVEAYHHHENRWIYLPDMINERAHHGSVSMGNKMFVIGGNSYATCEVFDNISRKFNAIKKIDVTDIFMFSVVGIGNKIFAFPADCSSGIKSFYIYDAFKDQWCEIEIDLSKVYSVFSFSRLPIV